MSSTKLGSTLSTDPCCDIEIYQTNCELGLPCCLKFSIPSTCQYSSSPWNRRLTLSQTEFRGLSVTLRSEIWDPTPGAQGPADFSADVVKRDAVVEAFKVETSCLFHLELPPDCAYSMHGRRMV